MRTPIPPVIQFLCPVMLLAGALPGCGGSSADNSNMNASTNQNSGDVSGVEADVEFPNTGEAGPGGVKVVAITQEGNGISGSFFGVDNEAGDSTITGLTSRTSEDDFEGTFSEEQVAERVTIGDTSIDFQYDDGTFDFSVNRGEDALFSGLNVPRPNARSTDPRRQRVNPEDIADCGADLIVALSDAGTAQCASPFREVTRIAEIICVVEQVLITALEQHQLECPTTGACVPRRSDPALRVARFLADILRIVLEDVLNQIAGDEVLCPECSLDSDCPTGQICQGGSCVIEPQPECTSDADCAEGEVCAGGICVLDTSPECNTDADCAAGQVCESGACVTAPIPSFTAATILHRGSEQIAGGPEVDSSLSLVTPAGYSVVDYALSGDGQKVWFVLYDEFPNVEGDPQFQLWVVNTDGSGGQRSSIPDGFIVSGLHVTTDEDGSIAAVDSGFGASNLGTVTAGSSVQLLAEDAPCARGVTRVSDDGSTLVYASFCTGGLYTVDTSGGDVVEVAPISLFSTNGIQAAGIGFELDITSSAATWVIQARSFDSDLFRNRYFAPLGMGLSNPPFIENVALPRDDLGVTSLHLTDDGSTIAYCIPAEFNGPVGRCYIQDLATDSRQEITDLDEVSSIGSMAFADDGSRLYAGNDLGFSGGIGFFVEAGAADLLTGGTSRFTGVEPLIVNPQLSDDGMKLAGATTSGMYILHDGDDNRVGFPSIDGLAYRYDDENDALIVRLTTSTPADELERIYQLPLYRGIEPTRTVPEDENPFYRERGGGGINHSTTFTEVETGVWERTVILDGKKAFINNEYRLRVIMVDSDLTTTVFQDFTPLP